MKLTGGLADPQYPYAARTGGPVPAAAQIIIVGAAGAIKEQRHRHRRL